MRPADRVFETPDLIFNNLTFDGDRDVQTEEKFEFIINDWLAVDKGDGEVRFAKLESLIQSVPGIVTFIDVCR